MVYWSHKLSLRVNLLRSIGNTLSQYMQIVCYDSFPELPAKSLPVLPRPPVTYP
jgi:hypothetical protein